MTINWGHKLTIAFILFGALMFLLVYKSIQSDFQLVSKDYYQDELQYQQVIDGTVNANKLSTQVTIIEANNQLQFQFPAEIAGKNVTGVIYFYCSYDNSKDRRIDIQMNESGSQIIEGQIKPGNYTVKISWQAAGKNYYNEQYFTKK